MRIILEMEGKKTIKLTPEIGKKYIIEVTEDGQHMNIISQNAENVDTSRIIFNDGVMFIDNGSIVQK